MKCNGESVHFSVEKVCNIQSILKEIRDTIKCKKFSEYYTGRAKMFFSHCQKQ